MKKLTFVTLLFFFSNRSYADTIDFWHFYYNDSVILKCNLNYWGDDKGGYSNMNFLPTATIRIKNIYTDSIAFMYFCDFDLPFSHKYFFIKDDKNRPIYTIPAMATRISPSSENKNTYMIGLNRISEYLKIYKLLKFKPKESNPVILNIYYSDYDRKEMFPKQEEKLLGTIRII